jgi:hypothetical protein
MLLCLQKQQEIFSPDPLSPNRTLKSLELRGCCFATRGWRNFSDALSRNDALEELSLADIKMPDAGAEVPNPKP